MVHGGLVPRAFDDDGDRPPSDYMTSPEARAAAEASAYEGTPEDYLEGLKGRLAERIKEVLDQGGEKVPYTSANVEAVQRAVYETLADEGYTGQEFPPIRLQAEATIPMDGDTREVVGTVGVPMVERTRVENGSTWVEVEPVITHEEFAAQWLSAMIKRYRKRS